MANSEPAKINERYCSLCRNHQKLRVFNGHKRFCKYNNSTHFGTCKKGCRMTVQRRKAVSKEKRSKSRTSKLRKYINNNAKTPKRKASTCMKCFNHNKVVLVKLHKKKCPYQACDCLKCKNTQDRRDALKVDVKQLRRSQRISGDIKSTECNKTLSEFISSQINMPSTSDIEKLTEQFTLPDDLDAVEKN